MTSKDRSDADGSRTRDSSKTRIHNRNEKNTNMVNKMHNRNNISKRSANDNKQKNKNEDIPLREMNWSC